MRWHSGQCLESWQLMILVPYCVHNGQYDKVMKAITRTHTHTHTRTHTHTHTHTVAGTKPSNVSKVQRLSKLRRVKLSFKALYCTYNTLIITKGFTSEYCFLYCGNCNTSYVINARVPHPLLNQNNLICYHSRSLIK